MKKAGLYNPPCDVIIYMITHRNISLAFRHPNRDQNIRKLWNLRNCVVIACGAINEKLCSFLSWTQDYSQWKTSYIHRSPIFTFWGGGVVRPRRPNFSHTLSKNFALMINVRKLLALENMSNIILSDFKKLMYACLLQYRINYRVTS